jgi:hypothetical protein
MISSRVSGAMNPGDEKYTPFALTLIVLSLPKSCPPSLTSMASLAGALTAFRRSVGDILLPVYQRVSSRRESAGTVAGCDGKRFDGYTFGRHTHSAPTMGTAKQPGYFFFLCRFLRSRFLRLCVAIFFLLRFLPQGIFLQPFRYYSFSS